MKKKPGKTSSIDKTEVIYTINDPVYGKLDVYKTNNAWWLERWRLEKFLDAKKLDLNNTEAAAYSSITLMKCNYFLQRHPHFVEYIKGLSFHPRIKAKISIVKALDDPDIAFRYLEKKAPEEFGNTIKISHETEIDGQHAEEIANAVLKAVKMKKENE